MARSIGQIMKEIQRLKVELQEHHDRHDDIDTESARDNLTSAIMDLGEAYACSLVNGMEPDADSRPAAAAPSLAAVTEGNDTPAAADAV